LGSLRGQGIVLKLVSTSPEETRRLGEELGRLTQAGDILLLTGGLGAGKTCLTQGIARGLGVEGYATSPTFVVVNQYRGRLIMYHIDLYRIDTLSEVTDLGLDDYLYGDGICVVEWADKALDAFPAERLLVEMGFISDTSRSIVFKPSGERYQTLLSQFDRGAKKVG
jgi:tRNA threonylcarbamoyladenosine biosynthesis protein TsaE